MLLPVLSQAQAHHEIGITSGVANYKGDLQDKWLPSYGYKPMVGITYKYFMNPHVGIRFGAAYTTLTAADSLSDIKANRLRNLNFTTRLVEAHAALEINLWPIDLVRTKISPYLFAGVAVFYSNPYTTGLNGEKVYLKPLSTEGQGLPEYPDRKPYSSINAAFPIGGGMKFLINKTLVVSGEIGYRYTTTDYIDDVSKSYVNLDVLTAHKGTQAAQLSYRGNKAVGWDGNYVDYTYKRGDSRSNDWYWFGNITIAIYLKAFGNVKEYWQTHCPRAK
jgi:hypothetical protein